MDISFFDEKVDGVWSHGDWLSSVDGFVLHISDDFVTVLLDVVNTTLFRFYRSSRK